ncbi:MAG: LysR family transcriptional regulator [Bacteroidia bacterium]|nr:LysR family transcriptional regulator [Bacteroidia bacterium]
MELRQLKYFVMVSKTLNYSEAARKLFITQGTLSQQIMQLEDELGSKLFVRSSHSVALTEAGEELLPLAKSTLEASDLCRSKMNDLHQALTGTLNIGVTHSFVGLLTGTVRQFLKIHPGVKLKIYNKTATELIEMLRQKDVDLIIAYKPSAEYDDIEAEPLFDAKLCAVMRNDHPLAEHKSLCLADLERQGIVLPGSGLQVRKAFEHFVGVDTRKLNVRVELNDPDLIMDIVQGTELVAIVSSLAAFYRHNLIAIPLEDTGHEMSGCVQWIKNGYRKRSAEAFLEMLRDSAQIERLCREMPTK